MELQRYVYRAIVTEVYDGDTIVCDIDKGFRDWKMDERIRLIGINAPELRKAKDSDGKKARDFLESKIGGREIILQTHKDQRGKYGRMLGTVWLDGVNINDLLISAGHAVPYMK